ncbi:MAG: hypothetical protein V5B60_21210 [Accumulibacter sp.]|uniref:hypothetical protein n=1 Tax=Accumulibacter sp. TaxID=2053492 RepID=UPI002FC3C659
MSVVVPINGREAIPVRAIPFVTGWDVSPDMVAKSLANSSDGLRLYRLTAYQHHANGSHTPILPKEWDGIEDRLRGLSESLKTKNNNRHIARPQWLKKSVPILPAGVFVWRDDLQTSWHRFSAQAGTRKGERPNDGMLNFSPLISPPETRAIVMEGFEGLPLAATAAPIVGEEPERARHDEEYDSAWDELESSSYHEQMGLAVLASLYPRGKRAVNISDERCLELARSTCLQVADWIELTGVRLGKHEHYFVEQSSVSFVKWSDEAITDAPTGWQPAMLRDNKTLPLPFPCTPEQLLQFVDTLHVGVHAFRVPDAFRQAVSESVPTANTAPQVPEEARGQAATSGATEVTLDGNDGQGEAATQASNAMEAFRRAVLASEHSTDVAAEAIEQVSQDQGCKPSEANPEHEVLAKKADESGDAGAPVSSEVARQNRQEHDIAAERGCRRMILEHWDTIEKLHGPRAKGAQVARFLRNQPDNRESEPSLKTIRNRLIDLRKQKLIP